MEMGRDTYRKHQSFLKIKKIKKPVYRKWQTLSLSVYYTIEAAIRAHAICDPTIYISEFIRVCSAFPRD